MFKKENRIVFLFIIIMALFVGLGIYGAVGGNKKSEQTAVTKPVKTTTTKKFNLAEQPFRGSQHAPVQMIEFYDYQCPYCQRFEEEIFPKLDSNYFSKGKVLFIGINLAFENANSLPEGMAAMLFYKQDPKDFWNYHYDLYKNQQSMSVDEMATLAKKYIPSLDKEQFKKDIMKQPYIDNILANSNQADKVRVKGTPTLFINGKEFTNPFDYNGMSKYIDSLLNTKGEK